MPHAICVCDACGRKFFGKKAQAALERHARKVHGGWDCETCGREFGSEEACGRHEAKCELPRPVATSGRWVKAEDFPARQSSFGFFPCPGCAAWWLSAHARRKFRQQCKACRTWLRPRRMWQNDPGTKRSRKGARPGAHASDRCEACRFGVCSGA